MQTNVFCLIVRLFNLLFILRWSVFEKYIEKLSENLRKQFKEFDKLVTYNFLKSTKTFFIVFFSSEN